MHANCTMIGEPSSTLCTLKAQKVLSFSLNSCSLHGPRVLSSFPAQLGLFVQVLLFLSILPDLGLCVFTLLENMGCVEGEFFCSSSGSNLGKVTSARLGHAIGHEWVVGKTCPDLWILAGQQNTNVIHTTIENNLPPNSVTSDLSKPLLQYSMFFSQGQLYGKPNMQF